MYDRSLTVVDSIHDVETTLIIAFVLVVMVIFVFLGRVTDTLIPAIALPLSLLLTFLAMHALGYSLDNLSLMALTLAIGFLVDDAIVFFPGKHGAPHGKRNERPRSLHRICEGNQLHDSCDDNLTRRSLPSIGPHERLNGPDLSRVLDHDCDFHPCEWTHLAHAHAVDDLQNAEQSRQRSEEDMDGTGLRRHRESRIECLWTNVVAAPAPSLGVGRSLGDLPGRNGILLLHTAKSISPCR